MRRISTFPDYGDTSIWILRSVLAKTMMSTSSQSSPQTCTPLYTCVRSTAVHWAMRCWIHLARARRTNGRSEMSQLIPRCIACVWWWSNIILTTKYFDTLKHWQCQFDTHIIATFIQCQIEIERFLSWTSCDASSTNEKNGVLDAFYDFSSATFEIYPQDHSPQNINNIASQILFVCIIPCVAKLAQRASGSLHTSENLGPHSLGLE